MTLQYGLCQPEDGSQDTFLLEEVGVVLISAGLDLSSSSLVLPVPGGPGALTHRTSPSAPCPGCGRSSKHDVIRFRFLGAGAVSSSGCCDSCASVVGAARLIAAPPCNVSPGDRLPQAEDRAKAGAFGASAEATALQAAVHCALAHLNFDVATLPPGATCGDPPAETALGDDSL